VSNSLVTTWSLDSVVSVDSYAPRVDNDWQIDSSRFSDYCKHSCIPPEHGDLLTIIESAIGRYATNVGVDLAGGENGEALKDLLELQVISKALLTTYEDRRDKETESNPLIDHIDGNLVSPNTWKRIIAWRKNNTPDGFALVMHRPVGALQDLPPTIYTGIANVILDNIRPGGVFFSQIPFALYGPNGRRICKSLRQRSDIDSIILGEDKPFTSAVIIKKP